jgi:glycosyltransferase involved in cell wall biosynthesis
MGKVADRIPVTLNIMTYNQERFVDAAVQSALDQDYPGPLEVLITDDGSTDGTVDRLRALIAAYRGPHSVRLIVNRRNLGLIAHFNKVFAVARYDFIVCAAGDDISRSDRVTRLAELQSQTAAWLLYSDQDFIDGDGASLPDPKIRTTFATDWTLSDVARSDAVFVGATAAYHKELMKVFGPIVERDAYEDLVMGFRAALVGRIARCDDPLLTYRVGEGLSKSGSSIERQRAKVLAVVLGVLRQRMIDAKGFGLGFDDPVMTALRESIAAISADLAGCAVSA